MLRFFQNDKQTAKNQFIANCSIAAFQRIENFLNFSQLIMKKFFILLFFFLGTALVFSQQTDAQKNLLKKANENFELLNANPEKAFLEAKKIEKEAQKINAKEAELRAINLQCAYYKSKNDFENMMKTAQSLFQKSESYKLIAYQVIAKNVLFEAYVFNGLYDKAFRELEQGKKLINKFNETDSLSIIVKADLFISYSNYYMLKANYKNQLKYIKLAGKEYEKLSEGKSKQRSLYIYYSNLASAYAGVPNSDSAKYYAKLSQLSDDGFGSNNFRFMNLWILGEVATKEKNYKQALLYLKKAESLDGYKVHLNIEDLYDDIIEAYTKLNQQDSVKLYETKKDSLKLIISENQNKSLHTLLDEKDNNDYKKYIYIFGFVLVVMGGIVFLVIRKNRTLLKQEKASQQYLEKVSENPKGEDYSRLLKTLKENDPAFMVYFNEAFPEFSPKLKALNPEISSSEIEFCALLKLKMPTKDIARYKFIAPKTVLNKKYLIRDKLDIPKSVDIYQWFDDF